MKHHLLVALFGSSLMSITPAGAQKITVAAGDFDRENTVVSFALPQNDGKAHALRAADGTQLSLQIENGEATFVLPRLAKNNTQAFEIGAAAANAEAIEA